MHNAVIFLITFCLAFSCVTYLDTSFNAKADEVVDDTENQAADSEWGWILEDFQQMLDGGKWRNSQYHQCHFTIYIGTISTGWPHHLEDFLRYQYHTKTTVNVSGGLGPYYTFPKLTPDKLVPCGCEGSPEQDIFSDPLIYYTVEYDGEQVLEVLIAGWCDNPEHPIQARINGYWFVADPVFYEIIWDYLAEGKKETFIQHQIIPPEIAAVLEE